VETALFVRHAESVYSAEGRANGRPDVRVPLSERGVEQARALARELAEVPIDLCVTSRFGRTHETADLALAGRDVRRLVVPELDDPRYGRYEDGPLRDYLEWAWSHDSATAAPGGGESRQAIFTRYAAGFRALLARPEPTILAVVHSLPVAALELALEGRGPERRMPLVRYAATRRLAAGDLERAVTVLEAWCAAPAW
jgi:broad specificity phosphatase PhoE